MNNLELIGWIATAVAVTGVVLNNHHNRWCFALWWVSNAMSAGLHLQAGMWSLTGRDLIFLALAIYGFIAWSRKEKLKGAMTN